ncbi:hypothetical protein HGA34_03795, partial [Candidatus Falkowbacteria bacterium]|nr:hypothetical protein [Candidatus Falkowbacteria bacterium]
MWKNIKQKLFRVTIASLVGLLLLASWPQQLIVNWLDGLNVIDQSVLTGIVGKPFNYFGPKTAEAAVSQFSPTGGWVATGTASTTAVSNLGSWKATLASDNVYWSQMQTALGL